MHPAIALEHRDDYWACSMPEAPPSMDFTVYDLRCWPCAIALHAHAVLAAVDNWYDGVAAIAEDGPVTRRFQPTLATYEEARRLHPALPAID